MKKSMLRVAEKPAKVRTSPLRRFRAVSMGDGRPDIVEVAARLGARIPARERRRVPKDFSDRLDHYIYGAPKR